MPAPSKGAKSQRSIAKDWGVSLMTVQRWEAAGYLVQDPKALAEVLLRSKTSPQVRMRATEILSGYVGGGREETLNEITDAQIHARKTAVDVIADLTKYIQHTNGRIEKCIQAGDHPMLENLFKIHGTLTTNLTKVQLGFQKLGQDTGNTIGRNEAGRIFEALGASLAKAVSRFKEDVAIAVVGSQTIEEAANKLEPVAVSSMLMEPFRAMAGVAADCGLPEWVVDRIKQALGDYVEDGEKEFEADNNNES